MAIDNQRKAKALMRKMKAQLPIPVRATRDLVRTMKPHNLKLKRGQKLSIKSLFYMGDVGGIACDVTPPGAKAAVVCSLTQVEIDPDHPLLKEIRDYQRVRKEGIARKGRKPGSAFIEPSKKKRSRRRKRRR
ncbi:MAG: hypothetical protein U9R15_20820 [Chloroflexota bacterium]|nr:hypothetical protein [Chloroflexota bacterium]